jgi:hypothetical protein
VVLSIGKSSWSITQNENNDDRQKNLLGEKNCDKIPQVLSHQGVKTGWKGFGARTPDATTVVLSDTTRRLCKSMRDAVSHEFLTCYIDEIYNSIGTLRCTKMSKLTFMVVPKNNSQALVFSSNQQGYPWRILPQVQKDLKREIQITVNDTHAIPPTKRSAMRCCKLLLDV